MKTIWDAVNELKGEWKFKSECICATSSKNILRKEGMIRESRTADVNDCHYHICSKAEFNALVAEMSLGLDVNPINEGYYHKYLAADKQELEPAPIIDWDSAPDGKNYALANKDKGLVEFFREKPVFDGDNSTPCLANHENEELHLIVRWELHERPIKQESNIYTQEMYDNGERPSVGMVCFISHKAHSKNDFNKVKVKAITDEYLVVNHDGCTLEQHYHLQDISFKPIPPKVELINGEAYQFDFEGGAPVKGIYYDGDFTNHIGTYEADDCTNIKPLTVND